MNVKDACLLHMRMKHQSSFKPVLFTSLLSGYWYRAITRHRIIVFPHFSTFTSLVYLRLFSTSQPWALWWKARAQRDMASSSCFQLVILLLRSLYNTPNSNANSRGLPPMHYMWTHFLLACRPYNLRYTSTEKTCILFTLENRCTSCYASRATCAAFPPAILPLFTLGNKCPSWYATNAIYAANKRDLQVNILLKF